MLIAYFILLAVVAVACYLAATRGGRRAAVPGESRITNRIIVLAVVVFFAFGLVVPALVIVHNGETQASTAVGVHLTGHEIKGRELFSTSCSLCHTLQATNSVGRIGPDLDVRVPELPTRKARKALVLSAILEGRHLGRGNMPAKLYEGQEAKDIAAFVAAVAGHR